MNDEPSTMNDECALGSSLSGEADEVRPFAQTSFSNAQTGGIVKEHAVFLARPDGKNLEAARTLDVEKKAAGASRPFNDVLE
jgi:hypothetical protein